jgi:PAS domain S-box-containing protein
MAIASPDGYFSKVNPAFCTLLEMEEHEIVNKPFGDLIHPDDIDGTITEYEDNITGLRQASNFINRYRTKSGSYKWISWNSSAIFGENGYIFAYGRDVTDKKAADEALKQANQKLEMHAQELAVSNRELEQFAYIASHDLQEPLRMVTSFLTQLEKKYGQTLDDKARKYIFYAVDGAKRMRQIILDLLEYSRVGKYEYEMEKIPLNELINEVLHLDQNLIIEKRARVTVADLPIIECYRPPLIQVFHNLIVNAIKYSKPGVPPDIEISYKEDGKFWVISVSDNGIGISDEYFDKIFVIFQRLHSSGEYDGTGLGLAIVKKVVESLGGKMLIESEVGKGSTFSVVLPKKIVWTKP